MISRRQFLLVLGGGALLSGGVALGTWLLPDGDGRGEYPVIAYGRESCSFCGMTIADGRFASAWRAGAVERHFDDIGCMVSAYHRDRPAADVRFLVHDYRDESWLDAAGAAYVLSAVIKTPMGYGVAAVSNVAAAEGLGLGLTQSPLPWDGVLIDLERKG